MSFNSIARRVRDPRLSLAHRICLFRACATQMMWARHVRRSEILDYYCQRFGIERDPDTEFLRCDEQQLMDALNAMVADRTKTLDRLNAFHRQRVRQKMRGRRQMSRAEQEQLESIQRGPIARSISPDRA